MAMKIKMLTLLQERRGYAEVTNRLPAPRPGVLFLMRLRARRAEKAAARRRLLVTMEAGAGSTTPLPVKINHVDSTEDALQVLVR
jgi:hypothetical protein